MSNIHLKLDLNDFLEPCPFCSTKMIGLELCNTHRASYWIECPCGAQVHGTAYGRDVPSDKLTTRHHKAAKKSAITAWNRRAL